MTQVPLSPFDASDAQDQVLAFSNLLSAYYSIPLIESIYDNGFSIEQLRRLKTVFEIGVQFFVINSLISAGFIQQVPQKQPPRSILRSGCLRYVNLLGASPGGIVLTEGISFNLNLPG